VKVIMPPASGCAHPVDLWWCGHHYRACLAWLLEAGARVEDPTTTAYRRLTAPTAEQRLSISQVARRARLEPR
jgi:hypothetical protein